MIIQLITRGSFKADNTDAAKLFYWRNEFKVFVDFSRWLDTWFIKYRIIRCLKSFQKYKGSTSFKFNNQI